MGMTFGQHAVRRGAGLRCESTVDSHRSLTSAEVWQRMCALTRWVRRIDPDIGPNGSVRTGSAPNSHLKGSLTEFDDHLSKGPAHVSANIFSNRKGDHWRTAHFWFAPPWHVQS